VNPSRAIRRLRPFLRRHPRLKRALREADRVVHRAKHSVAGLVPGVIRPCPRHLTVAVTAACNLRCLGCRYGRDYMVGEQLALETVLRVLDDAKDAGVSQVRFYGGEPLLHPGITDMVRHATGIGLDAYVNTNGLLLRQKIDALVDAGMRWFTMGFYGVGGHYDRYTQRPGRYARLEENLAYVCERYADVVERQLNWLLMRSSGTVEAVNEAWGFAERFGMAFQVNLVSYSLPFFHDGPNGEMPFSAADREKVEAVGKVLLALKDRSPERFPQSRTMIRAIPDLLMSGPAARIPCDAYETLWVGADGTVRICDAAFELGNVNQRRLRDIVGGAEHRRACREAFRLNCPNCFCKMDSRISRHGPSLRKYRG
jgi:MoaA/NifB/PqqE/SkfB family radical SAM enzyme